MKLELDGRTALVGGASSGLGLAVAHRLAGEGARVALVARSAERLERAAAEVRAASGGEAIAVVADLTVDDGPERAVAAARQAFGPVTVVVANGGGPPAMPAVAASADDLMAAARLLLLPVQRLLAATLADMRAAGWGRFVAITSVAVRQPQPDLVLSNSLRAAVTGYLKSVADEIGRDGITVNTVCPGYTATERLLHLSAVVAERTGQSVTAVEHGWGELAAVKRLLEPDEVAAVVAFLCSGPASGITGAAIPVDGGFSRSLL